MVQAYRLLIRQMMEEFNECYPLHLGVTEAGDGEDGIADGFRLQAPDRHVPEQLVALVGGHQGRHGPSAWRSTPGSLGRSRRHRGPVRPPR